MKRYKLLKDLPFAKAGEIFKRHTFKSKDGLSDYDYFEICKLKNGEVNETAFGIKRNDFIDNLDDWFEEIDDETIEIDFTDGYYSTDYSVEEGWHTRLVCPDDNKEYYPKYLKDDKEVGLVFESEEEAEKHLDWLKARATLLRTVSKNGMFNVCHNSVEGFKALKTADVWSEMVFATEEDAENSIKNHEKEWRVYLGIE